MKRKLYKITAADGGACNGGSGKWRLNHWRSVRGKLWPCENGLHLCRTADLGTWSVVGRAVWRCECQGEEIHCWSKVVVRRARTVEFLGIITLEALRAATDGCSGTRQDSKAYELGRVLLRELRKQKAKR